MGAETKLPQSTILPHYPYVNVAEIRRILNSAPEETLYVTAEPRAKQACRVCGCTDDHACPGGCWWAEPGLCNRCVGE